MASEIEDAERLSVETKAAYHAALPTATRAELERLAALHKAALAALSVAIRGDAKSCPTCGAPPHGMLQEIAVRRSKVRGYGIGCLGCKDHYAEGFTQAEAAANWNAGAYRAIGG